MQAVVVKGFGSADQLSFVSLPDLIPGEGEVVIDVEMAGVGRVDVLQRQGYLGAPAPGYIPGVEVAGRVALVGGGVDEQLTGKRVFAQGQGGGYAQQFVASAKGIVELPEDVSSEAAVALGVNALVARFSIRQARLGPGDRILVRGANGGIGAMVAQMAVRLGASVTAVTNSGASHSVAALGVQQVVRRGIDPEPQGPFDVIIDPVAGEAMLALIGTLAPNGRYVVNGAAAGFPPDGIGQAMLQNFSRSPAYSLLSLDSIPAEERLQVASEVFAEAARGELHPLLASILPLQDAATAHRMLETGGSFGKLLLQP